MPHLAEGGGKPVLFVDFHGTICHDLYWRSLPADRQHRLQAFLFRDNPHLVLDWMRGRYTAEQVNRLLADELGLPFSSLWQLFVADCRSMRVDAEILARLSTLRQAATVILITDNMDSFSRFTIPALGLDAVFDAICNSARAGRLKTSENGALYLHYVRSCGANIEDCTVLDDARDACDLFEHLGGTAHRVTLDNPIDGILTRLEHRFLSPEA